MHKQGFVFKPAEPAAVFNGLVGALVNGTHYAKVKGNLSFGGLPSVDEDTAPRGYDNQAYIGLPRLHDIDPTSVMALSLQTAAHKNPQPDVGHTKYFAAMEYLSAVSSQFARWFTEYMALYSAASKSEQSQLSTRDSLIEDVDIAYGDGDVAAYYAAVGDITQNPIAYPSHQVISVDKVHQTVMSLLSNHIDVLDNEGFKMGEAQAREFIGIASLPETGSQVLTLQAQTLDSLYRHPWRNLLSCPRTRDTLKPAFMSRVRRLVDSDPRSASDNRNGYIALADGDSVLYIPFAVAELGWDAITNAIDERPTLSSRMSKTDGEGDFFLWTDQFYTIGDVTEAIFTGEVDPMVNSRLRVVLGNPTVDSSNRLIISNEVVGTGALSSVAPIAHAINVVGSTHTYLVGNDVEWVPGHSGDTIPGGVMNLGSCAAATALNWYEILRSLRLKLPAAVRTLLDRTGRSKKTLPSGVNSVAYDRAMARALFCGQRDGYINSQMLGFNVDRTDLNEQEGPLFAGSFPTASGVHGAVATYTIAGGNGWGKADSSAGRLITNPFNKSIALTKATFGTFTGNMSASRYSTWMPRLFTSGIALNGGSDATVAISGNLLSMPGAYSANLFKPRYVPTVMAANDYAWLGSLANVESLSTMAAAAGSAIEGYELGLAWESVHPTRGFMRGLASHFGTDTYVSTVLRPVKLSDNNHRTARSRLNHSGNSASDITSNVGSPVLAQRLTFLDDEGIVTNSTSADNLGTHCFSWLWDYNRADIVGKANYRWAGHMFTDVLPHPYVPHPIAVFPAAVELSDITVGESVAVRSAQAAVINGGFNSYATTFKDDLDVFQAPVAINTSVFAADEYMSRGALFLGSSSSWSGMVGYEVSDSAGAKNINEPTIVDPNEDHGLIPAFERICSLVSGVGRGKFNTMFVNSSLPSAGLNRPPNATVAFPAQTGTALASFRQDAGALSYSPAAPEWISRVEGELAVPFNMNNAASVTTIKQPATLVVDGKGFLYETDLVTGNVYSYKAWLESIYSQDGSLINNMFVNHWPSVPNDRAAQVENPGTGPGYYASMSAANAPDILRDRLRVNPAVDGTGIPNDWFRKSRLLDNRHARLRSKALVNPWLSSTSGSGLRHSDPKSFDSATISRHMSTTFDKLAATGASFGTGLTTPLFLELQTFN